MFAAYVPPASHLVAERGGGQHVLSGGSDVVFWNHLRALRPLIDTIFLLTHVALSFFHTRCQMQPPVHLDVLSSDNGTVHCNNIAIGFSFLLFLVHGPSSSSLCWRRCCALLRCLLLCVTFYFFKVHTGNWFSLSLSGFGLRSSLH